MNRDSADRGHGGRAPIEAAESPTRGRVVDGLAVLMPRSDNSPFLPSGFDLEP